MEIGIDLPRDIGGPRLSWARLRRYVTHAGPDTPLGRQLANWRPGLTEDILRRIEFWVHSTAWQKTKDAKNGLNKPTMIPFPGDRIHNKKRAAGEYAAMLTQRQARRRAELERI